MNVLTVGALAHGEGLDARLAAEVQVRPITRENEPSPFSRIGPGINGAIMKRGDVKTTTNTLDVKSLEGSIAAVTKAGGTLIMPKTPIPGVGYFAYCVDPEGNVFGMLQADVNAK